MESGDEDLPEYTSDRAAAPVAVAATAAVAGFRVNPWREYRTGRDVPYFVNTSTHANTWDPSEAHGRAANASHHPHRLANPDCATGRSADSEVPFLLSCPPSCHRDSAPTSLFFDTDNANSTTREECKHERHCGSLFFSVGEHVHVFKRNYRCVNLHS